jgi:DnaK suppressor protein
MLSTAHPSTTQRAVLTDLLYARLTALEQAREAEFQGLSQAESARETLLQDADDAAQRASAYEVDATVSDLASDEYDAISNALQRVAGDGYGMCSDCQTAIPFERLRIEPQAVRCAPCQTLHESEISS